MKTHGATVGDDVGLKTFIKHTNENTLISSRVAHLCQSLDRNVEPDDVAL